MTISRMLLVIALVLPAMSGSVAAATGSTVAEVAGTSVSGNVTDDLGAPVAGARVTLQGKTDYTTTSDAKGAFALNDVAPGLYTVTVVKPGYTTAVQNGIAVISQTPQVLQVRMDRASFSSLRTIATVRAYGHNAINTSPASVNVVSAQTFANQAQPQVTRVLNQIPGVQISFPGSSANGAAPGSITVPNIRAAASYETATLIDGHPVATSSFGDYVTSFLSSYVFGGTEVVKGPGADAPEVNNAIGGTINFRTREPTQTPTPEVLFGFTNHGGTFSNFLYSDTVGRLGFVVDVATNNNPSALDNKTVMFDPSGGFLNYDTSVSLSGNATFSNVGNTASNIQTGYSLLACCYTLHGNLDTDAQLLKLRYRFSPSTSATVSYLGSQSFSDQNGNVGNLTEGQFIPGDPSYSGSLQPGPVGVDFIFPGGENLETNNEPIFQGEISTTLGKDTLLARYYHASISRLAYEGNNPNSLDQQTVNLYGVSSGDPSFNINQTFNGESTPVAFSDYFRETEADKLAGVSFEYNHPIGDDLVTLSIDQTNTKSTDFEQFPSFNSVTLPEGSSQLFTTYLARGHFYLGHKFEATLSNYLNTYRSTYPASCPFAFGFSNCSIDGSNVTFATTTATHDDPRIGVVFRPNAATAVRFSAGSSIAPPYLALLSQISGGRPVYNAQEGIALTTQNSGQLKPETAFGYDLGADARLKDGITVVSGDIYLTNLFNHYFGQTVNTGSTCGTTIRCAKDPNTGVAAPPGTPILGQTNTNISNFRFEGIELSVQRSPARGFGFLLSGALQRGYVYDLPPFFYCSIPKPNCTMDQNLNIIPNQNLNGEGISGFANGSSVNFGSTIGSLNNRIPYAQANGELSYSFSNGAYASFGDTYYGNNNSLNRKPFGIAYATLRYPVGKTLSLQVSGDNIFSAYSGLIPIYGGGLPITAANGQTAATVANVLGPATYTLVLTAKLP